MASGSRLWRLVYLWVPVPAMLIALATGLISSNGTDFGFPFPWRTLTILLCLESFFGGCFGYVYTNYNWLNLLLDAVFYTVLGYGCLEVRDQFREAVLRLHRFMMRVPSRWKELAGPFRVSAIMGLLGGAYLAYAVPPWLVIERVFASGPPWNEGLAGIFSSIILVVGFLSLLTIPLGGGIGLLTMPMNDERRGIISLFVTVCSFIPVVFLSFQVLYWILQLWPIAIVASVWTVLLLMARRVLRRRQTIVETLDGT